MGLDDVQVSYMTLEDIDDVMIVEKLSFTIPWSKNALIEEVLNNRMAIYITAKIKGKAIAMPVCGKFLMKDILPI
ncbi:ribosomal-protein-S18p-alanine acetyltransferase [Acetivibrio straminisolvens JCM 21531]|uniref:Ribosomal-protein-S18p-alanine acetyltransferase n=1 Tax=Acetivibrio straminisolvens JCM 21531 TaxID=1294263 RepID=W4V8V1_9FIRM|nr:ribosomal-protein-S18p-alanine acetyltransferase [Acetivibrio straminisolvens JCM 21531]